MASRYRSQYQRASRFYNQLPNARSRSAIKFWKLLLDKSDRSRVIHLAEAGAQIPGPQGAHSLSFLQRGTLNVKLSLPVIPNQQTPHAQDEIYVIIRGRGILFHDGKRSPFGEIPA